MNQSKITLNKLAARELLRQKRVYEILHMGQYEWTVMVATEDYNALCEMANRHKITRSDAVFSL